MREEGQHHGVPAASDSTTPPEVSVVIPTHNRARLLSLALRSVVWQRDVDFEVIVVDDGSTDDTSEMVAALGDPRIRLIRHGVAQGVSAARNRGIAEARGAWVAFLDDDDLWAPDKLASQLEAVRTSERTWVYVGSVNIDPNHRIRGGSRPIPPEPLVETLARWNPMPGGCSNVMVRADVLAEVGGFDVELRILADWDLWLRVAGSGPPAWVARPLMCYRIHSQNMSLDTAGMLAEHRVMEGRYGPSIDRSGFTRYMATLSLRSGKRLSALALFVRASMEGSPRDLLTKFPVDVRRLAQAVLGATRVRLGLPVSRRARRRLARARRSDPNRLWKDEAALWLAQLFDGDIVIAGGSEEPVNP